MKTFLIAVLLFVVTFTVSAQKYKVVVAADESYCVTDPFNPKYDVCVLTVQPLTCVVFDERAVTIEITTPYDDREHDLYAAFMNNPNYTNPVEFEHQMSYSITAIGIFPNASDVSYKPWDGQREIRFFNRTEEQHYTWYKRKVKKI